MPRARINYIPRPDADFTAWVNQYVEAVVLWWKDQGLDLAEVEPLKQAADRWNEAYPAHVAAKAAAESARQVKDAARVALEKEVRPITSFVQSYPKTTSADRAEMGITVRSGPRAQGRGPSGKPIASVRSTARLTHELRLVDESTPTKRGKPAGTLGAEVWVKLEEPNIQMAKGQMANESQEPGTLGDPRTFTFLTLTTKATLRAEFPQAAGGKTAVYMARWIGTRGEKGPWSEVTTATVAA